MIHRRKHYALRPHRACKISSGLWVWDAGSRVWDARI